MWEGTTGNETSFDYFMVMPGVVVALALGRLLKGVAASLVPRREDIRPYWVHHLWAVLVFALLVQYWHTTANCNIGEGLPQYLLFFVFPVLGYFASAVLMPVDVPAGEFRFRDYYYRHAVLFFSICFIGMVSEILFSASFSCDSGAHRGVENWFRGLGAFAAIGLVFVSRVTNESARERIHQVVTLLAVLLFLVFVCWRLSTVTEEHVGLPRQQNLWVSSGRGRSPSA